MNLLSFKLFDRPLDSLEIENLLITTINAHSFNVVQKDIEFAEALQKSDVLLPDGISVVWAAKFLATGSNHPKNNVNEKKGVTDKLLKKIAGEDLFYYEMNRLNTAGINQQKKIAFFLGSSELTLKKIKERSEIEFPNVEVFSYSPPYKTEFTEADNAAMYAAINSVLPDVLFVGMTAPKQEKWAYNAMKNKQLKLVDCHICCIGAVFDFYAGTVNRAPRWMIQIHLEWFYRLIMEPKRMWRRYLLGNLEFVLEILKEKVFKND